MRLPASTRVLRLPGLGTFLAREGLRDEVVARVIQSHRENRAVERTLKRNRGTIVTRVAVELEVLERDRASPGEVAVKEVPVPWRRRLHYALGGVSPFVREFAVHAGLLRRGVDAPRPLACSLRPSGGTEILIAEYLDGCTPLRDLLWRGDEILRDAAERGALLVHLGRWLARVHAGGVWQRDMKPSNLLVRAQGRAYGEARLFLIDLTAVRLAAAPLERSRRVRNLAQLLDLTSDLDGEPRAILLRSYLGEEASPADLEAWARDVGVAIEARRDARQQRCGYRFVDEEHRHTPK